MRPIDIFHIGPQKSGTTWLYENLKSHPQIAAPRRDTIHYFDIHYARGDAWWRAHFDEIKQGQKIFDPTFTTIRSLSALERIHAHNPDARIALTLRHPLERAYSHYWHEFKKGTVTYPFAACLKNYDLFQNWIEPGLPVDALKALYRLFPKEQILVLQYEDIAQRPRELLRRLFAFYGVDEDFEPPSAETVINAAGHKRDMKSRLQEKLARALKIDTLNPALYTRLSGRSAYSNGMDADIRAELMILIAPMIKDLEALCGLDLSGWK